MILNVDLDNEMTVKLIKKDKNGNIIQETNKEADLEFITYVIQWINSDEFKKFLNDSLWTLFIRSIYLGYFCSAIFLLTEEYHANSSKIHKSE